MKRLIALVLILLFPSLSFAITKEWYNNVQYLTKIPKTSLGDIVKTKPGSGNMLPTVVALASDTSPTVNVASGLLSVPLYAYSPIAGMAGQYVIGKGLQAVVDLAEKYNDGTLQTNPTLKDFIDDFFQVDPNSTEPSLNDVISGDSGNPSNCPSSVMLTYWESTLTLMSPKDWDNSITAYPCHYGPLFVHPGYQNNARIDHGLVTISGNLKHQYRAVQWTTTSAPQTWPKVLPPSLTPTLVQQLAQRIAEQIAANNETLKDAFKNLIKENPDLVPDPQQITNQDVTNYSNQEIYDNRQENIDYLTNKYEQAVLNNNTELANYYQDKIQEEQAKQEEEQAKEQKEESYNPISDNPFEEPYNPGPYDIPERFTSFLNNVKSTGLFSFSSSFFNSLPGGGSPIYTVEAGTYGTHTIDLSETMATGLAVLKTVLLLLFGFLSIRVVILKR